MFIPIVFAVLFTLAAADEEDLTYPGKCPEITPVEKFDVNRYVDGSWFTIYYHGKGSWWTQKQCPECRFSYSDENKQLFIEKYYLNDSRPVWKNKTKDHLISHPGSFQCPQSVRAEKTEWWFHVISNVVATDYTNYAVVWGCYDIEGQDKHYEFIVIDSRQRTLSEQYYNQAKSYVTERYPLADFRPIYWKDCRARCPQAE